MPTLVAGSSFAARTSGNARLALTGVGRANDLGASANGLGQSDSFTQPINSPKSEGLEQSEGSTQTSSARGATESTPTARQPSVQQARQPQPESAQKASQAESVQKADSTKSSNDYLFISEPLSVDEFAVTDLT